MQTRRAAGPSHTFPASRTALTPDSALYWPSASPTLRQRTKNHLERLPAVRQACLRKGLACMHVGSSSNGRSLTGTEDVRMHFAGPVFSDISEARDLTAE
eukprot:6175783-Pleurochrysis_carterae.AAC.1